MPGISLIFNQKYNEILQNVYENINKKFGKNLLAINNELKPHITLVYINNDKKDKFIKDIESSIKTIAYKNIKYNIRVNGLGIFRKSKNYILYFTVPYDKNLQKIHNEFWNLLKKKFELSDSDHYNPKSFTPHITIPIFKSNKTTTFKIMKELLKLKYDFKLEVSDIAFLTGNLYYPEVYLQTPLKN